ncbi:MAG: hypothetical protein ACFFE8_09165 [Candidatus Heimdallarchaeota archaeon]
MSEKETTQSSEKTKQELTDLEQKFGKEPRISLEEFQKRKWNWH